MIESERLLHAHGAPDQVVPTVTEDSRTLKFGDSGFERE